MSPLTCRRCGVGPLVTYRPGAGPLAYKGRGLCQPCYERARLNGTLIDYERSNRSRQEVLEEYGWLRPLGLSHREIAARLGMTLKALQKALERAHRAERQRDETEKESAFQEHVRGTAAPSEAAA